MADIERMDKFDFLIGEWNLEYRVPASSISPAATGEGSGKFYKALSNTYVYFDYAARLTLGSAAAHAVFAWDDRIKMYRYWWFEDSGAFMSATCDFPEEKLLVLNWHDSLLNQSFSQLPEGHIRLLMEKVAGPGKQELLLEVFLRRK